ncbi:hypothetical protein AVEN_249545-1 [Araneus ventricosus]|uniref:Uncharacterized protein n=1 Tax=Araneus ventricosus TaxID=182803 RepID=A0A4Y2KLV1_ARAVE|nr:hypothetical protein AVEN_249545-1 [Araneus ventricosus]
MVVHSLSTRKSTLKTAPVQSERNPTHTPSFPKNSLCPSLPPVARIHQTPLGSIPSTVMPIGFKSVAKLHDSCQLSDLELKRFTSRKICTLFSRHRADSSSGIQITLHHSCNK